MKRKRFSVEQIVAALKQVELGMPVADLTRRMGISEVTCFVETFNGSFRDECLNVHWFESLEEAREKIETWRIDYNDSRPHQGLKDMTPTEFALKSRSNEFGIVPQQAGD